jgi:hypothetical protein
LDGLCIHNAWIIRFLLSAISVPDQKDKMQVQQDNIEEALYVQDQQAPHITGKGYPPNERSLS